MSAETPFEEAALERLYRGHQRLMEQVGRVVVGQEAALEVLAIALFTGGHALLTGAPGLAKTLLIRTLAGALHLPFRRIQFTPDLMPADIIGSEIIDSVVDGAAPGGERNLRFVPGPLFTNVLLADEINRTPPKTQAALLEAMEEKQVTAGGQTRHLARPFHVFATQNPIELEGTYPLPEAQLDRFMFDIRIGYLGEDEELEVARRTTSSADPQVEPVFDAGEVLEIAHLVRLVPVAEEVARYAVRLVQATRPGPQALECVRQWVAWGAGPRASQSLLLGAKARALLQGRLHVSCGDIRALAPAVLRHRVLVNFRAEAEHVGPADIIGQLLDAVAAPHSGLA